MVLYYGILKYHNRFFGLKIVFLGLRTYQLYTLYRQACMSRLATVAVIRNFPNPNV